MNLCTQCGHEVPPRAKFCIHCGAAAVPRDPEETALRSELGDVLPRPRARHVEPRVPEPPEETLPRPEVDAHIAAARDAVEPDGADAEQPGDLSSDDRDSGDTDADETDSGDTDLDGIDLDDPDLDDPNSDDTDLDDTDSSETREHPRFDASLPPPAPAERPAFAPPVPAGAGPGVARLAAPAPAPQAPSFVAADLTEFEPWLTDEIDELEFDAPTGGHVVPRRKGNAPGLLTRWRALRGKTRAGVIGGIAAVVVFIVMVTLIVVAQGAVRGGATSPQGAVSQLGEALTSGDLATALGMVAPDERDALERIRAAAADAFGSLELGEAVRAVDGRGGSASAQLSLDGVTIEATDVEPAVSRLTSDLAVARFTRGTVTLDVEPAATEGLLRTAFATQRQPPPRIHESYDVAAAGDSAPTLMLRKVSGRWYVSPLLTALEYTVGADGVLEASGTSAQLDAGATEAAAESTGSKTPAAAAEAFAKAFGAATSGDLGPLAASVPHHESQLVALYGAGLLTVAGVPPLSVDSVEFAEGERDGGRVQATLDSLKGTLGGEPLELSSTCLRIGGSMPCLNDSGYIPAGTDGLLTLAADRGAISVTTVQEADGWRVSIIDTVADHAINWVRSLTRDQALATLGLERATPTDIPLVPNAETTVSFNSAGYATRTLRLDRSATVRWADDSVTATAYDASGEGHFIGSWSGVTLTGGDYTLVLQAGRDWNRAFAERGNTITYSATVRLLKY